jgi:hypothetical protein
MRKDEKFRLYAYLLISQPVLAAAVRTLPGNRITGHSPEIIIHARLADIKSASATPTEPKRLSTAVTDIEVFSAPSAGIFRIFFGVWRLHQNPNCCLKTLLI